MEPSVLRVGGRELAWEEYGDPVGVPVINCHGGLTSRLDVRPLDRAARVVGVRLISPDRPGIGRSTPSPGRALGDWPGVVVALADHLGIARFGVMGWSAGGPYALACAARSSERVSALALVASAIPYDEMAGRLHPLDRFLFSCSRGRTSLGRSALSAVALAARRAPRLYRAASLTLLDRPSRAVLCTTPAADYTDALAEGLRNPLGVIDDFRALRENWDLDLSQVRCPVHLSQGGRDGFVRPEWTSWLAARLPSACQQIWPDQGHFLPAASYQIILTFFAQHWSAPT